MNRFKIFFYLRPICILFIFANLSFAQQSTIPIGIWQSHGSFNTLLCVANDDATIYTSPNRAFNGIPGNILKIEDNGTLQQISKVDGLSDFSVAQLAFSDFVKKLVIVYENGNIDLLDRSGNVQNLNSILLSNVQGEKICRNIFLNKGLCYLSFDFGLVIVDIEKIQVKETIFRITQKSGSNRFGGSNIIGDSIYVAAEQGLFAAKLSSNINLLDVKNWVEVSNSPFSKISVFDIGMVNFKNRMYIANNIQGVYSYANGQWKKHIDISQIGFVKALSSSSNRVLVASDYGVVGSTDGENFEEIYRDSIFIRNALIDSKNKIWITGDRGIGFLEDKKLNKISYSGPSSSLSFRAYYNIYLDEMVILAGAYNSIFGQVDVSKGLYVYKNGDWKNFNVFQNPKIKNKMMLDMVDVIYDPLYSVYHIASFGFGMLSFRPNDTSRTWSKPEDSPFKFYDTLNSTFGNAFGPGGGGMRTNSLLLEGDTLWVSTHVAGNNPHALHKLVNNRTWKLNNIAGVNAFQMLIDSVGSKWFRNIGSPPVFVFNPKTGRKVSLSFTYFSGNTSSTSASTIFCLEQDRKGQIWVGTDKGVAIVNQPEQIFDIKPNDRAFRPIFEGFPLLYTEQILCIQVDGANRKWIGTNNGAWLLNEDGSEVIQRFTVENSPLPSNKVSDIEIFGSTGEVFFCTDFGTVSYRSDATLSNKESSKLSVFPSPVPPNYDGLISINGFPENESEVKITDEMGTLIYEGRSNGGSFVWNGRNYSGKKAKTGIYLVFSSQKESDRKLITKFAIIE